MEDVVEDVEDDMEDVEDVNVEDDEAENGGHSFLLSQGGSHTPIIVTGTVRQDWICMRVVPLDRP